MVIFVPGTSVTYLLFFLKQLFVVKAEIASPLFERFATTRKLSDCRAFGLGVMHAKEKSAKTHSTKVQRPIVTREKGLYACSYSVARKMPQSRQRIS